MNQREIKRQATAFVKGLLGGDSPGGMCYAVSAALQGYLSFAGVQCGLEKCWIADRKSGHWQHYYLRLPNGRILDPTASQFNRMLGRQMPLVYIGDKPDWYLEDCG